MSEVYSIFRLSGKDVKISLDNLFGDRSRFSDKKTYQDILEDAILSLFGIDDHSYIGASKGTGVIGKLSRVVGLSSFPQGYSQPEINRMLLSKKISPDVENANYLTEHLIRHGTQAITANKHYHILKQEKTRNAARDTVYNMSCAGD
jgi:hypothetical protein